MADHQHAEPTGVQSAHAVLAGARGRALLDRVDHRLDRVVVGGDELLLDLAADQRREDRDALGRREGEVVGADRVLARRLAELLAGLRMAMLEERLQLLARAEALEPERLRPLPYQVPPSSSDCR